MASFRTPQPGSRMGFGGGLQGPQVPLGALRAAVGGGGYTAMPVQTPTTLPAAPAGGPMQYHPLTGQAAHHAAALAAIAQRLGVA